MEFSMRNQVCYAAFGVALVAGASVAHAQTVETVIAPQPAVIAQQPAETIETVRTVQTTTTPRHRVVSRNRVTTTRTTVSQRVVPAPVMQPAYTEVVQPGLYDVVGPAPAVGPYGAPITAPAYRYVYESDRILVVDPYTNIAVRAIPR
jgi:hypothetical protein